MALTRYRTIVKVACDQCWSDMQTGQKMDTQCPNCRWLKYNNVTRLRKFSDFLNQKFGQWTLMNVYEYVKGGNGSQLTSFQRFKNEPVSDQL